MSNKFTTSAQKTLSLPPEVILKKLEEAMTEDRVQETLKKKARDGSKLVMMSFDKGNGK